MRVFIQIKVDEKGSCLESNSGKTSGDGVSDSFLKTRLVETDCEFQTFSTLRLFIPLPFSRVFASGQKPQPLSCHFVYRRIIFDTIYSYYILNLLGRLLFITPYGILVLEV